MVPVRIGLTIVMETPLSVGAGGTAGVLADRIALRDAFGRLILPGSHVKGRLRHTCEELARALGYEVCNAPNPRTTCPHDNSVQKPPCIICQIFGSPAYPSSLRFNDLVLVDPSVKLSPGEGRIDAGEATRPGIGVNRRRGVVEEKLLFFIETSPPGARFRSDEAIVGELPDEKHLQLLLAGLFFIRSWGGCRSRGLGWARIEITKNGEPVTLKQLKPELLAM